MAVSLSTYFPSLPSKQDYFEKAVHFLNQYLPIRYLDYIDLVPPGICIVAGTSGSGYRIFTEGFSSVAVFPKFTSKEIIGGVVGSICGVVGGALMIGFTELFNKYRPSLVNKEIISIVKNSEKNRHHALIFRTTADHNNAFSLFADLDHFQKLANKYYIKLISNFELTGLAEELKKIDTKYEIIEFQAHGTQDHFELDSSLHVTKKSKEFFSWLNDHIKDGGIIIIGSCEGGKGEDNIARQISLSCPQARVIASSDKIVGNFLRTKYDEDCLPTFFDKKRPFGKDVTRIYQNGKLVKGSP